MDKLAKQMASDLLWEAWKAGRLIDSLPEAIRPQTRAEGYAIQSLLEQRSKAPLFGWKIAATSLAGQAHIGVDGPLGGRLLAENVFEDGAEVPFRANSMRVAEAEFAFRMKRGLGVRATPYSVDEVLDAVDTLHPAIEVPDSRYEDFVTAGAPQLLADNACAHYFVLGAAAPGVWRSMDLVTHQAIATLNGVLQHKGAGAAVLGDPRVALTWLANELAAIGTPIQAGQIVTTGTCVVPVPVGPGDEVVNDMGVLGSVRLVFARE